MTTETKPRTLEEIHNRWCLLDGCMEMAEPSCVVARVIRETVALGAASRASPEAPTDQRPAGQEDVMSNGGGKAAPTSSLRASPEEGRAVTRAGWLLPSWATAMRHADLTGTGWVRYERQPDGSLRDSAPDPSTVFVRPPEDSGARATPETCDWDHDGVTTNGVCGKCGWRRASTLPITTNVWPACTGCGAPATRDGHCDSCLLPAPPPEDSGARGGVVPGGWLDRALTDARRGDCPLCGAEKSHQRRDPCAPASLKEGGRHE